MGTSNSNIKNKNIVKEGCSETQANPTTEGEIVSLYEKKSAMCKIIYKNKEGKKSYGTGFFCEINENFPIKKVLFTNNHILDEDSIEINKEIKFEYLNEERTIRITENRKKFTNKINDYTCIEIFDDDKINNYFRIYNGDINKLINQEIFILQYPNGGQLCNSSGKIIDVINNNIIKHSAATLPGSSGSPLIKRYDISFVLGIHFGEYKDKDYQINLATPFNIIMKDIKDGLSKNTIEYKNENNLIDYKKSSYIESEEDGKIREYNIYNNDLIYEGEFSNGKRNGEGKEYKFGKLIYEGEFSNGK